MMPSHFSSNTRVKGAAGDDNCIDAPASNARADRTVADVCMALQRPREAVDLLAGQMSGPSGDVEVPARRF